jgi:hypothetical protein
MEPLTGASNLEQREYPMTDTAIATPTEPDFPWNDRPLDEAAPPTTVLGSRGIVRLAVDHDARVDVTVSRYPDREPIRALEIVESTGTYTVLSFGWSEKHVVALAERFIAAFTDMRDGAVYDLAHPEEARESK